MKNFIAVVLAAWIALGCASNSKVTMIAEKQPAKPANAEIMFSRDSFEKDHKVIAILEVKGGREISHAELDAMLIKEARKIGADGVMNVDYDVDRDTYLVRHDAVVGRGAWRRHRVRYTKRVDIDKTATGVAVVFK